MLEFLARLFKRASQSAHPRDPVLAAWWAGAAGGAANVTPESAMRASAVNACVRILSESVASLPCSLYRRLPNGGKEIASNDPRHRIVHAAPNGYQTPFDWKAQTVRHMALRGVAYSRQVYRGGRVVALVPLHPDYMRGEILSSGLVGYKLQEPTGGTRTFTADEILRVTYATDTGIQPISPIRAQAETVAEVQLAQEYVASWFRNGGRPPGWIEMPVAFDTDAGRKRFQDSWRRQFTGDRAQSTPILEDGAKYHDVGVTNQDAQLLELRRFGVQEIARIFGVPLVLLQENATSTWGSGVEQFMLAFVMHTLRPWLIRVEQSLSRDLLTESEQESHFFEFNVAALLRGDLKSQYQAFIQARTGAFMTVNEVREKLNMNPIEGGDDIALPLNSNSTGAASAAPADGASDNSGDPPTGDALDDAGTGN
ncbi:MAG: phage portal protein [Gammaproteobacteria bacterium]|nr:phage portal protein [Gammaproteobacteria bacterium]